MVGTLRSHSLAFAMPTPLAFDLKSLLAIYLILIFYVTFPLALYLASYPTVLLAFYLAFSNLTCPLAFYFAFTLTLPQTFYLEFYLAFC